MPSQTRSPRLAIFLTFILNPLTWHQRFTASATRLLCGLKRMATPAQILANRQNALKSTGPRSAEGKAVSRFNALKTGIDAKAQVIPGENPAELQALIDAYEQ